jgi:hypothetical protein
MPDSSGLFVALDAPQRSPLLGIADVAGGPARSTGLQMAHASLSRDGKWIVAEHQEGCCASVTTPEIWIAPRSGGDAKTLVTAKSDAKGLALLGIDAGDRLLFRDGGQVLRVALTGGTPQSLGTVADFKTTLAGSTSPDGLVILVRGYDPLRWYIVAKDGVASFDAGAGGIVEDRQGMKLLFSSVPIWIGPHELLVSGSAGLGRFDTLTGSRGPLAGSMQPGDLALAYGSGRLLIARGTRGIVIDAGSGRESDIGIDLGTDTAGTRASALPNGSFVLSTAISTYRID